MRSLSTMVAAAALVLAPIGIGAAPAAARPGDKDVTLTSAELTALGWPVSPNTAGWAPGTASLPTTSTSQWQDVILSGRAPGFTDPGQLLTMYRFVPSDTSGSGVNKPLNITAVVQPNRSFSMHFQLGLPGTYGYAVGYDTGGESPEFVGFQFQFTTTGSGKPAPSAGSSAAVTLRAKKLAAAGFTKSPNIVGWGGTASISTSRAKAGRPVTLSGTAPAELKPGTELTLERFVPTDKRGSGHFEPVGNVTTVVKPDGSYSLTFELNQKGRYGYTFGAGLNEEWLGVEFQLKTT